MTADAVTPAPQKPTPLFAIGDKVILKSGGPTMTVLTLSAPRVAAGWFHEGVFTEKPFPQEALDKANG